MKETITLIIDSAVITGVSDGINIKNAYVGFQTYLKDSGEEAFIKEVGETIFSRFSRAKIPMIFALQDSIRFIQDGCFVDPCPKMYGWTKAPYDTLIHFWVTVDIYMSNGEILPLYLGGYDWPHDETSSTGGTSILPVVIQNMDKKNGYYNAKGQFIGAQNLNTLNTAQGVVIKTNGNFTTKNLTTKK